MKQKILRILSIVGTALLVGYVVVAGVIAAQRPKEVCQSMQIVVEDAQQYAYLTDSLLVAYIQQQQLNPQGKPLSEVDLYALESKISQHPLVDSAECYTSMEGDIYVHLTQRVPLMRVEGSAPFYVARDYQFMPCFPSLDSAQVIRVKGSVSPDYACQVLSPMADWIRQNGYWQKRIRYIQVEDTTQVQIVLRNDSTRVILGSVADYASKLNRLEKWYSEIPQQKDYVRYRELDLRYKGQIVGRR